MLQNSRVSKTLRAEGEMPEQHTGKDTLYLRSLLVRMVLDTVIDNAKSIFRHRNLVEIGNSQSEL